eukprot:9477398-Pyramimonas_sp.AAC.1
MHFGISVVLLFNPPKLKYQRTLISTRMCRFGRAAQVNTKLALAAVGGVVIGAACATAVCLRQVSGSPSRVTQSLVGSAESSHHICNAYSLGRGLRQSQ